MGHLELVDEHTRSRVRGPRYNPSTPEGKIESIGMFARGLGARRIKIAGLVFAIIVAVFALIAAL